MLKETINYLSTLNGTGVSPCFAAATSRQSQQTESDLIRLLTLSSV